MGFEIAMDHAFAVRGGERFGKLPRKTEGPLERQFRIVAENVVEIGTLDVRHRNELHWADFTHIVNSQNVFVRNLAGEK